MADYDDDLLWGGGQFDGGSDSSISGPSSGIDSDTEDKIQSLLYCTSVPVLKTSGTGPVVKITSPVNIETTPDSRYYTAAAASPQNVRSFQIDSSSSDDDTNHSPAADQEPIHKLVFANLTSMSASLDALRPKHTVTRTLRPNSSRISSKSASRYFQSTHHDDADSQSRSKIDLLNMTILSDVRPLANRRQSHFIEFPCLRCLEVHPDQFNLACESECWSSQCEHCKREHDSRDCPLRRPQSCFLCRSSHHKANKCTHAICIECPKSNRHLSIRCPRKTVSIYATSAEAIHEPPVLIPSCPICGGHHPFPECEQYDSQLDYCAYSCGNALVECGVDTHIGDPVRSDVSTTPGVDPIDVPWTKTPSFIAQERHFQSKKSADRYKRPRFESRKSPRDEYLSSASNHRSVGSHHSYPDRSMRPKFETPWKSGRDDLDYSPGISHRSLGSQQNHLDRSNRSKLEESPWKLGHDDYRSGGSQNWKAMQRDSSTQSRHWQPASYHGPFSRSDFDVDQLDRSTASTSHQAPFPRGFKQQTHAPSYGGGYNYRKS